MKLVNILMLTLLTSCTINLINSHNEGTASDLIDADPAPTTETNADFNLPALG